MHRIDTSTAQRDKFGQGKNGFTRGNPQTGTPATQLDYLYCDAIQEEIANAIESAGIKLDKSKHDQLATAIKEFVKKGSVKLNSSTNSTSETEAATPLAVKKVYELASNAVKKSGDEITGQLRFSPASYGIKFLHENGNELVLRPTGDSFIYAYYNAESNTWTNKLRYTANGNTWRFENIDDVAINGKSVLKAGDAVQLHGDLSNTNINNLTGLNEGIYFQGRNAQATTENGYPINQAGTLQVFKNGADGSGCCQIYTTYRNARQFIRNYRGGTRTWESWVEQITTANINDYLPVGIPQPWPATTPPAGWLKCNGWNFDKNKYPKLANAYPSGRLPELRAEFIRGLDDGRGVDPGREILSHQDCAIQSHNHSTPIRMFAEQGAGNPWGSGGDKYEGDYIFNSNYTGDNETRPRSVAYLFIVKAE